MGSFSLSHRREAGFLGAAGALLALTLAFATHFFAASADQVPTRCGALQIPVVPHPTAILALTPDSGAPSSAFNAGVSGIEMNITQGGQAADLLWEPGQGEQVLTFGTYAGGADSISIDGQVPANAAPGQHPVRVCWLYPPDTTWYYADASFNVTVPTPTPTASPTPTPTVTPTPTATPPGQTPIPSPTPDPTPVFVPMMVGDTDCDGGVDAVDSLLTLRFVAGLGGFGDCLSSADVDDDHDIDAVDSLFMLRDVAGLPTSGLPIGDRPIPTPPQYSLVVIAEEPWGYYAGPPVLASDVNMWGEVVGETDKHAFFWDPAGSPKLIDLGTLGGYDSVAYGVNDYHEVVGAADTISGFRQAFHWDPATGISYMGGPVGKDSVARDINSKGVAVGYVEQSSLTNRTFIWDEAGGMRYRDGSNALAINDWGVAVGSHGAGSHGAWPVGWNDDGSTFSIGSDPSIRGGEARGVSFTNQVVGEARLKRKGEEYCLPYECLEPYHEAFLWNRTTGMTDLGTLLGSKSKYCGGTLSSRYMCSGANDINMWSQAVGWSETVDSDRVAVLWNKGKIEDLNDLIVPGTKWKLTEATAINDQGVIACQGERVTGPLTITVGAMLLVPVVLQSLVIEPSSAKGGTTFTGRITLSDEAPIPFEVSLKTTSLTAYTSFPGTVTIPRGAKEATFEIETSAVSSMHTGLLKAEFGGWSVDGRMTINP